MHIALRHSRRSYSVVKARAYLSHSHIHIHFLFLVNPEKTHELMRPRLRDSTLGNTPYTITGCIPCMNTYKPTDSQTCTVDLPTIVFNTLWATTLQHPYVRLPRRSTPPDTPAAACYHLYVSCAFFIQSLNRFMFLNIHIHICIHTISFLSATAVIHTCVMSS